MLKRRREITDEEVFSLKIGTVWRYFKSESFAFWMICAYLFFEYFRPQSIYTFIDVLPWTKLVVIGAILGCFTDKSVRWVSSGINKLLILFLLVIFASSFLAYFPDISKDNWDKYYLWVIIYFLIINIVNTRKRFFIFLLIFLVSSFKISFGLALVWAKRGFSFTDWGLKGPPGFFENSGELAIQMLVFWPIAWAFCVTMKGRVGKQLYYLLLLMPVTAIMVILGASSRGAQIALILQLVVMNSKSIMRPRVLIAIGCLILSIWLLMPTEQKQRFERIGEDQTSQQRILYWENGLEMIKENPFFGVGYYNFAPYYQKYYSEDILFKKAELPHNIFIQVGTDAGLIGLSVFSLMIFGAWRMGQNFTAPSCEDNEKIMGRCANISLLGFVVAGQFVTVAYYPFFWIHLALLVVMFKVFENKNERKRVRKNEKFPAIDMQPNRPNSLELPRK